MRERPILHLRSETKAAQDAPGPAFCGIRIRDAQILQHTLQQRLCYARRGSELLGRWLARCRVFRSTQACLCLEQALPRVVAARAAAQVVRQTRLGDLLPQLRHPHRLHRPHRLSCRSGL